MAEDDEEYRMVGERNVEVGEEAPPPVIETFGLSLVLTVDHEGKTEVWSDNVRPGDIADMFVALAGDYRPGGPASYHPSPDQEEHSDAARAIDPVKYPLILLIRADGAAEIRGTGHLSHQDSARILAEAVETFAERIGTTN